jgi:hypothetical protein
VDVGKLPNHVKSVSQLSLDLSLFDLIYCSSLLCAVTTIGIRAMVTFLGRVSGRVGFGVVSLSATLDVRHSWNVERLTSEGEFGQCEETHK